MAESKVESCGCGECATGAGSKQAPPALLWLQSVTLAWMVVECGAALLAAWRAHSVLLLAFGSDSLVELFSALVVLMAAAPRWRIREERANRAAGLLLFVLGAIVALTSVGALVYGWEAEQSTLGIAIAAAALVMMPLLAYGKRRLARSTGNTALAADAVQSATCAWLAAGTLAGLGANALLHLRWIDSAVALAVLPILVVEGRRAMRGESCGCH